MNSLRMAEDIFNETQNYYNYNYWDLEQKLDLENESSLINDKEIKNGLNQLDTQDS